MQCGVVFIGERLGENKSVATEIVACMEGKEVHRFVMPDDTIKAITLLKSYLTKPDFYLFAPDELRRQPFAVTLEPGNIFYENWFYPSYTKLLADWCFTENDSIDDDDLVRFRQWLQDFFDTSIKRFGVEMSAGGIIASYKNALDLPDPHEQESLVKLLRLVAKHDWVPVTSQSADDLAKHMASSMPHVELLRDLLRCKVPHETGWTKVPASEFDPFNEERPFVAEFVLESPDPWKDLLPNSWLSEEKVALASNEYRWLGEFCMLAPNLAPDADVWVCEDGWRDFPQAGCIDWMPAFAQFSPVYDLCAHHIICAISIPRIKDGQSAPSVSDAWMMAQTRMTIAESAHELRKAGLQVTAYGLNDIHFWAKSPDVALQAGARGLILPRSFFAKYQDKINAWEHEKREKVA